MIHWVRWQVTHKPRWAYIKVILLGSSVTMVLCRHYTLYPCTLKRIPLPTIHPTQPNPIHSDPTHSDPIQSSPVQSVARCSEVITSVIFEACELFNESLAPRHCSQCIVDPGQRRTESGWRPLRRYSPKLCHLQGLSFDLLWPAAVCPPSRLNVGKAFYSWGRDLRLRGATGDTSKETVETSGLAVDTSGLGLQSDGENILVRNSTTKISTVLYNCLLASLERSALVNATQSMYNDVNSSQPMKMENRKHCCGRE